jgi:hypothetical protein
VTRYSKDGVLVPINAHHFLGRAGTADTHTGISQRGVGLNAFVQSWVRLHQGQRCP